MDNPTVTVSDLLRWVHRIQDALVDIDTFTKSLPDGDILILQEGVQDLFLCTKDELVRAYELIQCASDQVYGEEG